MARYCGKVGYVHNIEYAPGCFEEEVNERLYYGDVIRNNRRLQNSNEINDSINISNQISIVADPYATENIYAIRYAEFMGTKWKVTDAEVQFPRLILTLGGVYHG